MLRLPMDSTSSIEMNRRGQRQAERTVEVFLSRKTGNTLSPPEEITITPFSSAYAAVRSTTEHSPRAIKPIAFNELIRLDHGIANESTVRSRVTHHRHQGRSLTQTISVSQSAVSTAPHHRQMRMMQAWATDRLSPTITQREKVSADETFFHGTGHYTKTKPVLHNTDDVSWYTTT